MIEVTTENMCKQKDNSYNNPSKLMACSNIIVKQRNSKYTLL